MFSFKKDKPPPKFDRSQFRDKIDEAVTAGIKSRIHLLDLANDLESKADGLRVRHAIHAPL
jgi:hypothetical protein